MLNIKKRSGRFVLSRDELTIISILLAALLCFFMVYFIKAKYIHKVNYDFKTFTAVMDGDNIILTEYNKQNALSSSYVPLGVLYEYNIKDKSCKKLSEDFACSINIKGDWVYYGAYGNTEYEQGFYKIKKDGTGRKKISDELVVNSVIIKDYIYYKDADFSKTILYRMKLDGNDKEIISDDVQAFNVVNNVIYYSSNKEYGNIYSISLDGKDRKKICKVDGGLFYIKGGYIYYKYDGSDKPDGFEPNTSYVYDWMSNSGKLFRMKLDGTGKEMITDYSSNVFVLNNKYISYNNTSGNSIETVTLDGKTKKTISFSGNSFQQVVGIYKDWILVYSPEDGYFMSSLDGKVKEPIKYKE